MRIVGRGMLAVAVLAALLAAGGARADNNPNGMAFRAAGWFRGKSQTSTEGITCEIPTVASAIADGSFETGLWNTFGFQTLYFPDLNNPFGNPCGVWVQLQNNLLNQAIQVDHIALHYKILGARRFRQFVPARNGFPIACLGFCVVPQGQTNGECSNNKNVLCLTDFDCQGVCYPPNNPTECVCVY